MVKINGESVDAAGKTLKEYLDAHGYRPGTIAVEINQNIIPKTQYASVTLRDNDTVEVVSFVGGG